MRKVRTYPTQAKLSHFKFAEVRTSSGVCYVKKFLHVSVYLRVLRAFTRTFAITRLYTLTKGAVHALAFGFLHEVNLCGFRCVIGSSSKYENDFSWVTWNEIFTDEECSRNQRSVVSQSARNCRNLSHYH
jgi:hypothetical protein